MTTTTITARNLKRAAIAVAFGIVTIDVIGGLYHLATRQRPERCVPAPGYPLACQDIDASSRTTEHDHAP